MNSAVRSKSVRSVREKRNQLLRRVGLAVRLIEVSGGMVRLRAGVEQETEVTSI
jgi:hypothetical protein